MESILNEARMRAVQPFVDGRASATRGYYDPDALIDDGVAIEVGFDRLASAERDNLMQKVYHEMAEIYRRANKEVANLLRDVRGYGTWRS
jgi:hypothetical protein